MTEKEQVFMAEFLGALSVVREMVRKDHPGVAQQLDNYDMRGWELIDPAIKHEP